MGPRAAKGCGALRTGTRGELRHSLRRHSIPSPPFLGFAWPLSRRNSGQRRRTTLPSSLYGCRGIHIPAAPNWSRTAYAGVEISALPLLRHALSMCVVSHGVGDLRFGLLIRAQREDCRLGWQDFRVGSSVGSGDFKVSSC
ncbi:unnamed protein product [Urochloa humidicola]